MLSHLKIYVFLLLFAVCSIFPCSIFAVETEAKTKIETENNLGPFWILNHGTDADAPTVEQGNRLLALGLYQIQATGSDLKFILPVTTKNPFSAEKYPFFALRYRSESPQPYGGVFFTTETLTELSDRSYSPFPLKNDGKWQNLVVDLRTYPHGQWRGTVTSFRLDPTNPSTPGATTGISRLGFFATQEDAEKFLNAANDTPDYTQETLLQDTGFRCLIPGGTLTDGWKTEDFALQRSEEMLDAARKGTPMTVCRDGKPVPAHVNSRGYAWYIADAPGNYELCQLHTDIQGRAVLPVVGSATRNDGEAEFQSASGLKSTVTLPVGVKPIPLPTAFRERCGCDISSPFSPEYFTRKRIRIGAWNLAAEKLDAQAVQNYHDCGFDMLIATGAESSSRNLPFLLRECDANGIELYVNDGGWHAPKTAGEAYFEHPCFVGHFITDEPGSDAWERLGKVCRDYIAETGGKIPFINLLPMYANAAQLKYGAGAAAIEYYDSDPDLYRKHCEGYCDHVPTEYICTDIYPLNWSQGKRTTYAEYIESINVIAKVARERNREFWCCIQTFAWTPSKRTPNAAEFRWQCYSLISFGCRGLLCWRYCALSPEFPSLITTDGTLTPAWYDARTVFREIRLLSDIFCQYRNLGVFTHNASEKVPYLQMSDEFTDFPTIQEIDCPDPLLIGCFERENDTETAEIPAETAFTLVNMTELEAAQTTLVKLRLQASDTAKTAKTPGTVTVYRRGIPEIVSPDDAGFYAIHLESGEGVFVTVASP
ncbi:MAG: hypothetical protein Q4C70_11805 [Planctomycetia bacterium]|nr:hypothetical protein [Planctomycetia bacterium]